MNRFFTSVAEVLEVGEVGLETRFRETEDWCSLKAFGLLVMMENDFTAPVELGAFLGMSTVRDLYREAVAALAAEVFGVPRASIAQGAAKSSVPQWDSVNHLRLVMEAEKRFGVSFPIEKIPSLSSLDDFLVE